MADDSEFPQPFGKYTLLAKLGHGGMAEVFLALLQGPGGFRKLVVVKRTHKHLIDEEGFVDMFLDEARLAARLSHPNVVQTHEVEVERGRPYLVMEYLEGQPLNRILGRIRRDGRTLSFPMLAHMLVGVLDGLHYAHTLTDYDGGDLRVVHRDVSPHNLFVTYQGAVKVLDFGVAKAAGRIVESRTGETKGKLAYIPPDQASGLELDARADVWSCGVILWQATTNRALFRASTDMATIHNVMNMPVPPLMEVAPDAPPAFASAVDRALSRDRSQRWESASAMRQCLAAYLAEVNPALGRQEVEAMVSSQFAAERAAHQKIIEGALTGQAPSSKGLRPVVSATPSTTSTTVQEVEEIRHRHRRIRRLKVVGTAIACGTLIGTAIPLLLHFAQSDATIKVTEGPTHPGLAPPAVQAAPAPPKARAPAPAPPKARAPAPPPAPAKASPTVARTPPPPKAQAPDDPATTAQDRPAPSPRPAPAPGPEARASRSREQAQAATAPRPARSARTTQRARRPKAARAEPRKAAGAVGMLTLDTRPWAEVWLGAKKLGSTPLVRLPLPEGTHTLTLKNSERGLSRSYEVTIRAGETTKKRLGLD